MSIIGGARAILHVETTATVMGFAVSLSDVLPDGASHLVAKGMLNGTRRSSLREPEPMVPGEVTELAVEIDDAGWVFPKGHRIRVSVASADWPNVWPTPESGTNRVHTGAARPSRIVLPVVPAHGSAPAPEFEPSPLTLARHSDAVKPPTWQVTEDVLTGRRRVLIEEQRSLRINDTTVVDREYTYDGQVHPASPEAASAHGRHVTRIKRPNVETMGRSDVHVQASATHFHVTIDLELRVNGMPHLNRRWAESIPRRLL